MSFVRAMFLFKAVFKSIGNLLKTVTEKVLHAKIVFFDSNPVGRILTRFTKDVIVFDLIFPMNMLMFINGIFRSIVVVITVSVINPYVLIPSTLLLVVMIFVIKLGIKHMSETQRMDGIAREPIHNTFSMMINGLVSCRVADKVPFFRLEFMNSLHRSTNASFCNLAISRWMGLRLDLLCVTFTSSVTWFCLLMKGNVRAEILLVTL